MWLDYANIKFGANLIFEDITKSQRDSLNTLFKANSTHTFTDFNNQTYTVVFTDEQFNESIVTLNNVDYYAVNLQIEQI